ncbi:hypothetical protein F4779DRAFT_176980 [Xylariaceae sp. FL0662B]|nr:hypothetical protein F4779DRAFT_176980 [Xylariaceae sp. FL0662B]
MMNELSRPPTENGGSRPPTSRFQEGSMNDRVSAAPPVHFLGPDQLRNYEKQFYTELQPQQESRQHRRERPHSAAAKMQSGSTHPERSDDEQQHRQQQRTVTHKKSTGGFFSRVRDALGWSSRSSNNSNSSSGTQKQDVVRKHSSLQEPLQPPRSPPRHDHMRAQSETYISQLPNLKGGVDRPSREDVMQSYNQLVASGFFQSHAIQSTRHAGPQGGRRTVPLPTIPSSPGSPRSPRSPEPPQRTSSINAVVGSLSPQSAPASPTHHHHYHLRRGHDHHYHKRDTGKATAKAESPEPDLQTKESRRTLRGRKRSRVDMEGSPSAPSEPATATASTSASAASSFAEPLKRVAKKLRKTPTPTPPSPPPPQAQAQAQSPSPSPPPNLNPLASDGVLRLVPSAPSLHRYREKAVRMRSPSPAAPDMRTNARRIPQQQQQQPQPPRRVFSSGGGNKLRKRAKSPSPRKASAVEIWERAGGERTSVDGVRATGAAADEGETKVAGSQRGEGEEPAAKPLSVVPDANRGIPSVPRIPDQYHYYQKYQHQHHRHHGQESASRVSDENDAGRMEVDWQYGEAL